MSDPVFSPPQSTRIKSAAMFFLVTLATWLAVATFGIPIEPNLFFSLLVVLPIIGYASAPSYRVQDEVLFIKVGLGKKILPYKDFVFHQERLIGWEAWFCSATTQCVCLRYRKEGEKMKSSLLGGKKTPLLMSEEEINALVAAMKERGARFDVNESPLS